MLNNGLGRPKFIEKFSSVFNFVQTYIIPEKDKLEQFKQEERKKRKEWEKSAQNVNLQQQKIERAYEWLVYFKK